MSGLRRRLSGRLSVALPPDEAFVLFTARGEQRWAEGWLPRFPVEGDDDTVAGTVFETDAHGHTTTWVIVDSEPGRHIRYARATPGVDAGTVTVTLAAPVPATRATTDDGPSANAGAVPVGSSEVTVTYELTALSPAGEHRLRDFAADYPAFLHSWEEDITKIAEPRSGLA